ncbi:hypothetical protein [Ignavibacterium sp.]
MNLSLSRSQSNDNFKIGNVFAKERPNDFSVIMKFVIVTTLFFSIAVMIF